MKKKYFFITFILLSNLLFAQEKEEEKPVYGWIKKFVGNLNFTQNSFDNWAQGGEDSWSWQLDLLAKFNKNEEKYDWANSGKFSFGRTKVGDLSSRKAADEIKLESVLTYKVGVYVNPFISLSALTQFTEGFKYEGDQKIKISNILDPGYFTQSAGFGYEPNKVVKTRLGASLKETITDKYADIYANGEKNRVEFGAESVTDVNAILSENILFTSKLELFSKLKRFDEVDVNWDNLFSAKVTKYINVSFNFKLFYDKDITPKRQLKQTLALGLTYNFL
jgi:hypothetical protein